MKNLFTRSKLNPILRPNEDWWKIYNPAAAVDEKGLVHLFPRVMKKEKDWHSRIAHAVSKDGEAFEWDKDPVLTRKGKSEKRGLEDPRISKIGNEYHMAYAAYDGNDVELHTAVAEDLSGPWHKNGRALPDFYFFKSGGRWVHWRGGKPVVKVPDEEALKKHWTKSGALFPQRFSGKYALLFGEFYIWLATSEDGIIFEADTKPFLESRRGTRYFDNAFIEMGPPPILTEKGWLQFYHGIDEVFRYQLGFLLLDKDDPRKILYRTDEPVFGPQESYEVGDSLIDVLPGGVNSLVKMGDEELKAAYKKARETNVMPQVTFCPAAVVRGDKIWIYYGAGDASICAAWARLDDILKLIR